MHKYKRPFNRKEVTHLNQIYFMKFFLDKYTDVLTRFFIKKKNKYKY